MALLTEHSEIIDGITYTLEIEEDVTPLRGNVSASGDAQADGEAEDEVRTRLCEGNLWAWCVVTVTASMEDSGEKFEGQETLSNCSYRDSGEFMQEGGYYQDMRQEAAARLALELVHAVDRGLAAQRLLEDDEEED